MARIAISCTANALAPAAAHRSDPITASVAGIAAQTAVDADIITVGGDITAALLVSAIAGDAPSTTAVTLIQTDLATLTTDFATLKTALATGTASTVVLSFDAAAVVTKNQLRACLAAIMKVVDGSNDLT